MPSGTFTVEAVISDGTVLRHYRDRDHRGELLASDILLESDIDIYPAGSTVESVIDDLLLRIEEQA